MKMKEEDKIIIVNSLKFSHYIEGIFKNYFHI